MENDNVPDVLKVMWADDVLKAQKDQLLRFVEDAISKNQLDVWRSLLTSTRSTNRLPWLVSFTQPTSQLYDRIFTKQLADRLCQSVRHLQRSVRIEVKRWAVVSAQKATQGRPRDIEDARSPIAVQVSPKLN